MDYVAPKVAKYLYRCQLMLPFAGYKLAVKVLWSLESKSLVLKTFYANIYFINLLRCFAIVIEFDENDELMTNDLGSSKSLVTKSSIVIEKTSMFTK